MRFVSPKPKRTEELRVMLTLRSRALITAYAEYAERSEDELLDEFVLNLFDDPAFMEWVQSKRRNTRLRKQLELIESKPDSQSDQDGLSS